MKLLPLWSLVLSGVVHAGLALPTDPLPFLYSIDSYLPPIWLEQPEAAPAPSVTVALAESNCVHSEA